jgi:hypothetical protein
MLKKAENDTVFRCLKKVEFHKNLPQQGPFSSLLRQCCFLGAVRPAA